MACRPGAVVFSPLLILILACGVAPVPTRSPGVSPGPTASILISVPTPSVRPGPTPDPSLHVDGMATVAVAVAQVVDPAHPNHNRALNARLGTIDAGERVFLVATLVGKKGTSWQVYRETQRAGPLGWVSEANGGNANLAPLQPLCPTNFPLTAQEIQALGRTAVLPCFGETELTLTGTVNCDRPTIEWAVGGAAFLDANRSCRLDEQVELHGEAITSLLEAPTRVQFMSGRFLVRGHFDDPQAQSCAPVAFGTNSPTGPPEPGTVMVCRQMFVVSSATRLD